MKKFSLVLLALAIGLAITPAALADTLSYSFVGSGLDAKLTFTYDAGTGAITGISGTVFSAGIDITSPTSIISVVPNPNSPNPTVAYGFIQYDNLLFPNSIPILDFSGALLDANGVIINLFSNNGTYQWLDNVTYTNGSNTANPLTVAPTPEPGSLLLLGTGLLGLAIILFRKAKPSASRRLVLQT